MSKHAKLLVVDDQKNLCTTLALMLSGAGYAVKTATNIKEVMSVIEEESIDLVLTDLRLGSESGMDVLIKVKERLPIAEVILMTAYGTIENAVDAVKQGAFDYLQKPFSETELLLKVERALERRRITSQMVFLATDFKDRFGMENLIGQSRALRDVIAKLIKIAPTDTTVLVTGESGTGKELIARAIHAQSKRAGQTFIPINCAAMTETLLESELFGHAKGAFTGAAQGRKGLFEEASGGTFFFDEVGDAPLATQAKLLRAIENGEIRRVGENQSISVDVRIIAATNVDLNQAVAEKKFRQDLYYRLNVARLHLPPLRERKEDIPQLVAYFVKKHGAKMKKQIEVHEDFLDRLQNYDFPGNIRELENIIEQAMTYTSDHLLHPSDVSELMTKKSVAPRNQLQTAVDSAEKDVIERALKESGGNREKAAEALGLSTTTLWRKMRKLHIIE